MLKNGEEITSIYVTLFWWFELVPAIIVGSCPVGTRIETVCRKIFNAACVVVRLAQRVLHLSVSFLGTCTVPVRR
jgi:hypothetical protein